MTRPNPPPHSLGDWSTKAKIAVDQLQICGLEKAQPDLNNNRAAVKLPSWIFNNLHGISNEAAMKKFQDLTAETLGLIRKQQEEEEVPTVQKPAAEKEKTGGEKEKAAKEQVFVKFRETTHSLQVHIKKIVTIEQRSKERMPPKSPPTSK